MTATDLWGYGITIAVLLLLLGSMFALLRIMSDDSGKYEELRAMLDPIFHPPAFRQSDTGPDAKAANDKQTEAATVEPFEEDCPGCGEQVTHLDAECPSCGLRLL